MNKIEMLDNFIKNVVYFYNEFYPREGEKLEEKYEDFTGLGAYDLLTFNGFPFHNLKPYYNNNEEYLNKSKSGLKEYDAKIRCFIEEHIENFSSQSLLKKWDEVSENIKDLDKIITNDAEYFRHFKINRKSNFLSEDELLKLYIPFKKEAADVGISAIMRFLHDNNIEAFPKISKYDRSDNFVMRVTNLVDAYKVIKYVNTNPLFENIVKDPAPNCLVEGKVSLAKDADKSHNFESIKLLGRYIFEKSDDKEAMRNLNAVDFLKYLKSKLDNERYKVYRDIYGVYYNALTNDQGFKTFYEMFNILSVTYEEFLEDEDIVEYEGSLNSDVDFNEDDKICLNENEVLIDDSKSNTIYFNNFKVYKTDLKNLDTAILVTSSKYSDEQASCALEKFLENGHVKGFTNDNKARENLRGLSYIEAKEIIHELMNSTDLIETCDKYVEHCKIKNKKIG